MSSSKSNSWKSRQKHCLSVAPSRRTFLTWLRKRQVACGCGNLRSTTRFSELGTISSVSLLRGLSCSSSSGPESTPLFTTHPTSSFLLASLVELKPFLQLVSPVSSSLSQPSQPWPSSIKSVESLCCRLAPLLCGYAWSSLESWLPSSDMTGFLTQLRVGSWSPSFGSTWVRLAPPGARSRGLWCRRSSPSPSARRVLPSARRLIG